MKKLLKMLGLLFVAAMLFSCSGNDPDPITEYHLYYDDCFLGRVEKASFDQLFTYGVYSRGSDCNISGSTLTFTDSGFIKYLGSTEKYAFAIYSADGHNYANPISKSVYDDCISQLDANEDYSLKGKSKLLVLTASGYSKKPELLR